MKDANNEFVTIIKEKEEIFRKMVFPNLIVEEDIEKALFEQSIKKASGPDKLNFKALRLL
jgi:hypothetical protein